MNETQQKIYDYITGIINLNNIPVMLSYQNIASRLNISEITVKRNLDVILSNHLLYSAKLGNNIIYNTKAIDTSKDLICYIRNKV